MRLFFPFLTYFLMEYCLFLVYFIMLDSKILFLLENKRANVASFILEEQTLFLLKCIEQNSSSMSKGITASAALFSPLRDVDQYLPYFLSSHPQLHSGYDEDLVQHDSLSD